jgi:hypothetical protein
MGDGMKKAGAVRPRLAGVALSDDREEEVPQQE